MQRFWWNRSRCIGVALLLAWPALIPATQTTTNMLAPAERLQLIQQAQNEDLKTFYESYLKIEQGCAADQSALLRQCALSFLTRELSNTSPLRARMALVCAGLTGDETALTLYEAALQGRDPQLQLLALQGLCRYQNDTAERALGKAMRSPYLALRVAAAEMLAAGRYSSALEHIEGLMYKCDTQIWPLFPPLYAALDTQAAERTLKRLLSHSDRDIRLAAILCICKNPRNSLTATFKSLATHTDGPQQEACAYALGKLTDSSASVLLERLTKSPHITVNLAAQHALYRLGKNEPLTAIADIARTGNLYAIQLLGALEDQTELLVALISSDDAVIRLNAATALLKLGDKRSLKALQPWLLASPHKRPVIKNYSPGQILFHYAPAPAIASDHPNAPILAEMWLAIREEWLSLAQKLPEESFLKLASAILNHEDNDLIPHLFTLLSMVPSDSSEKLLQSYAEQPGTPLIRHYCHVALLHQNGSAYSRQLVQRWVEEHWHHDFLAFRPSLKNDKADDTTTTLLKPRTTTSLFLSALETLASTDDTNNTDWLLKGWTHAHPHLRSAFAALLVHCLN
jgi:HEAT repeat protein